MFYFIPAWENLQVSKVDETLSQIKMLHSIGEEYQLLLTSYMPDVRTFLLLEGLANARYHSVYDEMQNISQTYENKINVYDLNWPPGISFVYSQFAIFAIKENQRYASIYFDSLNNLKNVDFFKKEQNISERYWFDDRGFISSIEYYEENVLYKKDFFNEINQLQFTIDVLNNNRVILGEVNRQKYGRDTFSTLNDFVKVVTDRYMQDIKENGVVIVALDDKGFQVNLSNQCRNYKVISSIFSGRSVEVYLEKNMDLLVNSDLILVDHQQAVANLSGLNLQVPIKAITPYDAVLRLGESQQVAYYQIHYVIDGKMEMKEEQLLKFAIKSYLSFGWHFRMHCLQDWEIQHLKGVFISVLTEMFNIDTMSIQELMRADVSKAENNEIDKYADPNYYAKLAEVKKIIQSITFEYFMSKEDLLASLLHTRIIVDLSDRPDVLTQICGISTGIPMINCVDTGYVVHQKNGWIIKNQNELLEVLHYYLDGLKHWNEALVYSVKQLKKYTDGAIIHQWKEWLNLG